MQLLQKYLEIYLHITALLAIAPALICQVSRKSGPPPAVQCAARLMHVMTHVLSPTPALPSSSHSRPDQGSAACMMKQLNAFPRAPCHCFLARKPLLPGRPPLISRSSTLVPLTEHRWHHPHRHAEHSRCASPTDAFGDPGPSTDSEPPEISLFPRIRERDPYRSA